MTYEIVLYGAGREPSYVKMRDPNTIDENYESRLAANLVAISKNNDERLRRYGRFVVVKTGLIKWASANEVNEQEPTKEI
jgi:hypothetical protein